MGKRLPRADRLSDPDGTPQTWAMSAALEPLDKVASDAEARWGIGILERLATPETAAKFGSAKRKLEDAITAGDPDELARRASVLMRGWQALEREAIAAGYTPGDPGRLWFAASDSGKAYVFVQHESNLAAAVIAYPDHIAVSLNEVMRMLEAPQWSLVERAKELFPAATVEAVRVRRRELNDEIPF